MDTNCYEIRVIDGVQFLFYKGEKLPNQTKSVIMQDVEMLKFGKEQRTFCEATITVRALLVDTINADKQTPPLKSIGEIIEGRRNEDGTIDKHTV